MLIAAVPERLPMRWLLATMRPARCATRAPVIIVLPLLLGGCVWPAVARLYDARFASPFFVDDRNVALVGWTIATISRHERALQGPSDD
jgi:hypothetical protein